MDYNVTYRKKDKGWQVIVSYKDSLGNWKQKSKQGFSTKRDAKPFADKLVQDLKKSTPSTIINSKVNLTFGYLFEEYINYSSAHKEYYTIKSYRNSSYKFSSLNNIKVTKIEKNDIQRVIDDFIISGLKKSSIQKHLSNLKGFFNYLIELHLISSSPIYDIKLPKINEKLPKKSLTLEELFNLLEKIKTNKFYTVALIAGTCGLRLGEILGLTWKDVDFDLSTLSVNKQWKLLENKKSGFGKLKSINSYRTVPIPRITLDYLKELKQDNLSERIAPFNASSISKYLNPKLRELSGISIHELRHTYATNLISNGIDFKTAAKLLGHDVEQTMRTYSHVTDEMYNKAACTINKIF